MAELLPYKISTLVYLRNTAGELLLMQRRKEPNLGLWSCIGGKLEMATGESPAQAARREVAEEVGLELGDDDLHLFGLIAERAYEGSVHWLMFLFDCRRRLEGLPDEIREGRFAFHPPEGIDQLPVPETDRVALWPLWFQNRGGFTMMRADCSPGSPVRVQVEQEMAAPGRE